MRVVAIIPAKNENPADMRKVINLLPFSVKPIIVWFERPAFITNTECLLYGIEQLNKRGVGCAYCEGFEFALKEGYTHCLMYDADGDMDATIVPEMLGRAEKGYDLVVASRWARGGGFKGYDKTKLIFNFLGNLFFRIILITPITDLTFGFKLLSADLLSKLNLKSQGHGIYAETTMLPIAIGARCCEIPTIWKGRQNGVATLSISEAINTYLRVGWQAVKKAYGIVK